MNKISPNSLRSMASRSFMTMGLIAASSSAAAKEPKEPQAEPVLPATTHQARNAPCRCGSGRKAKKCCR